MESGEEIDGTRSEEDIVEMHWMNSNDSILSAEHMNLCICMSIDPGVKPIHVITLFFKIS